MPAVLAGCLHRIDGPGRYTAMTLPSHLDRRAAVCIAFAITASSPTACGQIISRKCAHCWPSRCLRLRRAMPVPNPARMSPMSLRGPVPAAAGACSSSRPSRRAANPGTGHRRRRASSGSIAHEPAQLCATDRSSRWPIHDRPRRCLSRRPFWSEIPASLMGIDHVSNEQAGSIGRSRRYIVPQQETEPR